MPAELQLYRHKVFTGQRRNIMRLIISTSNFNRSEQNHLSKANGDNFDDWHNEVQREQYNTPVIRNGHVAQYFAFRLSQKSVITLATRPLPRIMHACR